MMTSTVATAKVTPLNRIGTEPWRVSGLFLLCTVWPGKQYTDPFVVFCFYYQRKFS